MPVELSSDLPPDLVPLAWLVGRWEGAGVVGYPTITQARFGQEVEFRHDGRPFLHYLSRTWLLDDSGSQLRPLATETGFWRPTGVGAADHELASPGADASAGDGDAGGVNGGAAVNGATPRRTEIEVLLTHPMGYVEMYVGHVTGPRIELATDVVARSAGAKEYTAATRMYGLVDSDLLWVMDMAAVGQPLQSHASARLRRV